MAFVFKDILVNELSAETLQFRPKYTLPVCLQVIDESDNLLIRCKNQLTETNSLCDIEIFKDSETALLGQNALVVTEGGKTTLFVFNSNKQQNQNSGSDANQAKNISPEPDLNVFHKLINDFKLGRKESVFSERTDESSASQYFQFYGYLSQQQNMMQDYIRTSTYQKAILANLEDFKDKIVLDVGAGSGILSFFAAQAGARKVYAVEASSMAKHAETLVFNNKLNDRIQVIPGKIEEISLPEHVDIIISEPMGYMLFNERMLETYLHAKKWLAPNGKMFPTRGDLHIAPFSDSQLYYEQVFVNIKLKDKSMFDLMISVCS